MSLARYLQIHALLKKQILTGQIEEGSMLPSENQLSLQHQITRSMVRQALNELEKEGLIRKQKGKGSFVERKDQRLGLLSFRGFSEVIGNTSHLASSRLLQPLKKEKWGENFFFDLNESERNQGCIVIKRLREVDGLPVMLEQTYLPDILANFLEKEWENGSLFKTLQVHYQVQVRSVEQYIRAIVANDKLADYLKLEKDMPLLKINRKYASSKAGFFIYSTLYCNTENYALGSFME
jgi:GntR family transcriptional regulator/GntR family frlABCD operon transcriptional regulator